MYVRVWLCISLVSCLYKHHQLYIIHICLKYNFSPPHNPHTLTEEVLHYDVDLKPTPHLDYSGPCCLELRGDNLVVWTNDMGTQVARWKLAHIRSFKAKKNLLSIFAGRSVSEGVCVCVCECVFV